MFFSSKVFSVSLCLCGIVLFSACNTPPQATAPSYDLLIRNALIVDGSGGAPRKGSVAISGGKIAAVGEVTGTATRTINARGRTIAPGFIDMHSHSDMALLTDGNDTVLVNGTVVLDEGTHTNRAPR